MSDSSRSRQQQLSLTQVRRIQDEEAYPYILTAEIGKGSFATVYKGFHSVSIIHIVWSGWSGSDCG